MVTFGFKTVMELRKRVGMRTSESDIKLLVLPETQLLFLKHASWIAASVWFSLRVQKMVLLTIFASVLVVLWRDFSEGLSAIFADIQTKF